MKYVSERIINISELEGYIKSAYCAVTALKQEAGQPDPSLQRIRELSNRAYADLLVAKDFEFCIERRLTHYDGHKRENF